MESNPLLYTWSKQYCMAIGGVLLIGAITACSASAKSQPPAANIQSAASHSVVPSPTLTSASPTQNAFSQTPPVFLSQSAVDAGPLQREASQVVYGYYRAIDRQNYQQAYSAWEGNGAASHQSFEQFSRGFSHTASTAVTVVEPGRTDAAAGSIYIEIPVRIDAVTTNGTQQQFRGSYTLRRVNHVPGSTSEQRRWHLYLANITQVY